MRSNLILAALSVAFGAGSSSAAPILALDFDPLLPGVQSTATVRPGESLVVEIRIAEVEATAPLNAFELDLVFDPSVATSVSAAIGPFLVLPMTEIENVLGPDEIGLAAVTIGPGAAFGGGLLGVVVFEGVAVGAAALSLDNVVLSSPFGVPIEGATLQGGTLHVVPEPTTTLLLGLGVALLAVSTRRAAR